MAAIKKNLPRRSRPRENLAARLTEFYRWLGQLQDQARARVTRLSLDKESARRNLEKGQPLLNFEDLPLDWPLLKQLVDRTTQTLSQNFPTLSKRMESLSRTASDPVLLPELARSCYTGSRWPRGAGSGKIQRGLSRLVVQAAMQPFIAAQAEALLPLVNQEGWRRGYCPICGGSPDFAFLEKETGSRWLLCSRCDARWLFLRLECPFCGNQDQNSLSYLTDEVALHRVYLCEECRTYLKCIDLSKAKGEVNLPLERGLTLEMDREACQAGYRSPSAHPLGAYPGGSFCGSHTPSQ